jgi:hypothetical protein
MAKKKPDVNVIGDRGEALFFLAATTSHGSRPLFRPASLGSKWPIADYAVELYGRPGQFFLVQVKSTRRGRTAGGRIRMSAKKMHVTGLRSASVPAYIVIVDEKRQHVFLARPRFNKAMSSASTRFSLKSAKVRSALKEEVVEFWKRAKVNATLDHSAFLDR